jgi:hypothetical protein
MYRINFEVNESRMKCEFTTKRELLSPIEIETFDRFENAEPSTNSTFRGISIDLREE